MTNFTKFAFCTLPLAVAAVLSFNAQAQAAIIAQYHLGELGSVSGSSNLPQDSSGNGYNFINQCCGSVPTVDTTNVAPGTGSTASLSFGGGYYATTGNPSITDNFQLDLWARATDTSTTNELFVSNSDNTGSLKIHEIHNGSETDWAASFSNVAWIGAANGAGQPVTLNAWEHIQVAVVNGTATLYLNGVAQPSTASSSQFSGWAGMHLGVTPGGQTHFTGNIDEVTISSVPEPACLGILGVGAMGLLARRRRDG